MARGRKQAIPEAEWIDLRTWDREGRTLEQMRDALAERGIHVNISTVCRALERIREAVGTGTTESDGPLTEEEEITRIRHMAHRDLKDPAWTARHSAARLILAVREHVAKRQPPTPPPDEVPVPIETFPALTPEQEAEVAAAQLGKRALA